MDFKFSDESREEILALIPEDEKLKTLVTDNNLQGVVEYLSGLYWTIDTIGRGLSIVSEADKANRPDLARFIQFNEKMAPKYGPIEDVLDKIAQQAKLCDIRIDW